MMRQSRAVLGAPLVVLLLLVIGVAPARAGEVEPSVLRPFPALPDNAILAATRAAAPPQDPREIIPVLPPIPLSLSPEIGDALPALRARLARRGDVVEASPADFRLGVNPDFPQTLVLNQPPLVRPADGIRLPVAQRIAQMGPTPSEVGNLLLDDYARGLDAELDRIGWARRLISLGPRSAGARATTICYTQLPGVPDSALCDIGGQMRPVSFKAFMRLVSNEPTYFALRNDAREPRYLYLVLIDSRLGVTLVPVTAAAAGAVERPTPPGRWMALAPWSVIVGETVLVTISSKMPLARALLDGFVAPDPASRACAGALAAVICGQSAAGVGVEDASWSASSIDTVIEGVSIGAVGNGWAVASDDAPWMAELYSTVPYVEADFVADDRKPPGEKQHLRARARVGLYHRCGGTMIAPDLMLTAAHCVAKDGYAGAGALRVFKERRVRVGSVELGRGGLTYPIDAMAVHAGYRSGQQRRDIALIHLALDRASDGRLPDATAELPWDARGFRLDAGDPVTVYGWGFTGAVEPGANVFASAGSAQQNPALLQYGEMEAMSPDACKAKLGRGLIDIGMLCATTRRHGPVRLRLGLNVFSCVGDSGGPLVRETGGRAVLVGIVSWSVGCGAGDSPSVFTNVEKFGRWVAAARTQIVQGRVILVDDKGANRPPTLRSGGP